MVYVTFIPYAWFKQVRTMPTNDKKKLDPREVLKRFDKLRHVTPKPEKDEEVAIKSKAMSFMEMVSASGVPVE